jgi:ABC-type multidrug transport system fused ATPase/permease subunit
LILNPIKIPAFASSSFSKHLPNDHFKEPWIQHATVRENILFGKTFDRSKYKAVLKACALEEVGGCY